MDIGCQLPMQGPVATRDALVTFARQAEGLGMASLWVSDHVVFPLHVVGLSRRAVSPSSREAVPRARHLARGGGDVHHPGAPGRLGVRPRPSAPRPHGQDADHDRHALERPADLRRRSGLVEAGDRDPRRALPRARPPGGRDAARLQGAVDVGSPELRRRVLSLRRHRLRPQAGAEAASADLGRRRQRRRLSSGRHARRRLARVGQDACRDARPHRASARGRRRRRAPVAVAHRSR